VLLAPDRVALRAFRLHGPILFFRFDDYDTPYRNGVTISCRV
jgi:hypothetical protein